MSFVVKGVKKVVKAVGNIITGVVKAIGNVISSVIDFVASPFMGLFGVPDMPSDAAEAERQQGVLLTKSGSNVNIPIVYGYRKVGGIVTFAETGSDNNRYLWVTYVLSEGPIEGLHEVYLDDYQLPSDIIPTLNQGTSVDITEGKYKDRVRLQFINVPFFYSRQNQHPIIGNHICRNAPSWRDDMIYNGLTIMMARYEWKEIKTQEDADNNPFTGAIPKIQATIMGKRVASLISTDQESFEYETSGYRDRYSTNPAEILLDYLRNPRYGKGLMNDEIDWNSFRIAAAKCNQQVEYVNGIRGPILTTNAVVDTSTTLFNNTKLLLSNMRGYLPYVQGKYKLKIEDAGDPTDILSGVATIVKTFTKNDIVGSITYTGIERNAKFTHVTVKYVDPDNKWSVQEVTYPESESERLRYKQIDGGRENSTEITFSACTNYAIAKDMARLIFNKSRFQDTISFRARAKAFDLEVGDNIHIDSNILKFSGQNKITSRDIPWRVVTIKLNNDYTFDIGCVRNEDSFYPHARVGEQDIILPPYVPKGAEIYYPPNPVIIPRGLVPPSRSQHPDVPTDTTNPADDPELPIIVTAPPTDPTGNDGGGVGDPSGDINDDDLNPNNPPPIQPPPLQFNDIIDITNVVYTQTPGSSGIDATFTFIQPSHPQYLNVDIYYKISNNLSTSYFHINENTRGAPGSELTFTITNLRRISYELVTRVNYSTGDAAVGRGLSYFFPEPGTSTDILESGVSTENGWDVAIAEPVNNNDSYLEFVSGQPLLTNGSPRDPRQMNVTVRQYTAGLPLNDEILGLDIYYKPTSFEYWFKARHNFNSSYTQGENYTFTLPFTLGSAGTVDKYDFTFRFVYNDGTQSKFQSRFANIDVESPDGVTFDFDPFEGQQMPKGGREPLANFDIVTTDEEPIDPPSADPREFILVKDVLKPINEELPYPRFNWVVNDNWSDPIYRDFSDPGNVFLGVRVTYRNLSFGANNDPVVLQFFPLERDKFGRMHFTFPITFGENYEYVITPYVNYLGNSTPCKQSWYGRGAMTRFLNVNQFRELNFRLEDTNVALRNISDTRTIDPANPTLQILGFELVQLDNVGIDNEQCYYRIQVNHSQIPGFTGVKIYRRQIGSKYFHSQFTSYGFGRWEEIDDTQTDPVDGNVIYNLRRGISWYEFNENNDNVNDLYTTNKLVDAQTGREEFLIIVQANGAGSGKAYFLSGNSNRNGFYRVDLLPYQDTEAVDVTIFDEFPVGSQRNLNEARANITSTDTLINGRLQKTPGGWSLPTPLDGPAVV